jgi:hypothetical protein
MSQPAGQDSSPHPQGRVVLVTGATSGIGFGKPGRYPPGVADPAVQDHVVWTAADLARHAPTAADHTGRP